jgi:hypothetical protein
VLCCWGARPGRWRRGLAATCPLPAHPAPTALRRYTKLAAASGAYVINQFGLSCFKRLADGGYEARTFNFYVFPLPSGQYSRKFTCDAGSLAFLARWGLLGAAGGLLGAAVAGGCWGAAGVAGCRCGCRPAGGLPAC